MAATAKRLRRERCDKDSDRANIVAERIEKRFGPHIWDIGYCDLMAVWLSEWYRLFYRRKPYMWRHAQTDYGLGDASRYTNPSWVIDACKSLEASGSGESNDCSGHACETGR